MQRSQIQESIAICWYICFWEPRLTKSLLVGTSLVWSHEFSETRSVVRTPSGFGAARSASRVQRCVLCNTQRCNHCAAVLFPCDLCDSYHLLSAAISIGRISKKSTWILSLAFSLMEEVSSASQDQRRSPFRRMFGLRPLYIGSSFASSHDFLLLQSFLRRIRPTHDLFLCTK